MNVGEDVMFSGKWIRLKKIHTKFPDGSIHDWETFERTTKGRAEVDFVEIVATLKRKGQEDALILLNIYRPPIGTYILELPAGMVDAGESIETAGLRELKEETGYTGKIVASPPVVVRFSQAISNTSSRIVFIEVDGDLPENQNPKTSLEEDELCRTVILPISTAYQRLLELSAETGSVDGKVFMLIAGFLNIQQFKSN